MISGKLNDLRLQKHLTPHSGSETYKSVITSPLLNNIRNFDLLIQWGKSNRNVELTPAACSIMFRGSVMALYDLSILIPALLISIPAYWEYAWCAAILIILTVLAVVFSVLLPRIARKEFSEQTVEILGISPNDAFGESLALYALPIVTVVMDADPIFFMVVLLITYVFFSISDSRIPNPMMRLMGYHFYKVDYDKVHGAMLISKNGVLSNTGKKKVFELSKFVFLDSVSEKNV